MPNHPQLHTLDSLPAILIQTTAAPTRRLVSASPGCLALTGYTAEELTAAAGPAYGELIHPEDQPAVTAAIEAALAGDGAYDCLYRLRTRSGEERWLWERGRVVNSAHGAPPIIEGLVVEAGDLAQGLKKAEQQAADGVRKVSALHGILEAVSTPAELPLILEKSLRAALAAAQGVGGFIHLRDKSGKQLRLVAREGIPESVAQDVARVSAEDGLVAWVARHKQALHIPSIQDDPRTVYLAAGQPMQVYVGVPIARGPRVWGTLSVLGTDPAQFSHEEVSLLVSVGEEIGIVVENARLRRHAERLLLVQERNRLARELHDSVSQSLYSVTLFAEAGRRLAAADNPEVAGYFSQIGQTGQQALKEMRLLIYKLRPSVLAKEGLVRALQQRLNSVEGRAGVKSHLQVEGDLKFKPALEDALYHIAQEALNNALKHALASEVTVRLELLDDRWVSIEIEDNGRGFDPATAAASDGMGLVTMRERAESFGGSLTIDSTPGHGCRVCARLSPAKATRGGGDDFELEDLA